MLRLRIATQWGCSIAEVESRMPASELPLWTAWQYIEPFGWTAQDLVRAKLAQMQYATSCSGETPSLADFITKPPDWRAFDPELHEQMEADRMMRNLQAVMGGELSAE